MGQVGWVGFAFHTSKHPTSLTLYKHALKDSATYACQRNYRSGRAPANRYRTIHHYRAELERSLRADPTNPRFRMTYSKTVLSATVLRGWHANFYYAAIQKDALQTYSCALVRK